MVVAALRSSQSGLEVLLADYLHLGQRKDHFCPIQDRLLLPLEKLLTEVPRQNKIVVGLRRARLFFGDNWNVCSKCSRAGFLGVPIGGAIDDNSINAVPLQKDVAFR